MMKGASVGVGLLGLLLACVTTAPTDKNRDWDIYSFHINSTVTSRYATTIITSRVANRIDQSQEIEFHVKIPKNAFISKFKMTIEGQTYDGVVKQKEEAQQQYTQAVSRGQSAGIVSSVGRTLEEFKTSVTVAALSKVTFELTYEELLKRRMGKYELLIHARPMQPVADFKIDVYINERPGIHFLEITGGLSTKALANAITKTHASSEAWVHFYPSKELQSQCESCGEQGLNGDLVITYDVHRKTSMGDLNESEGYFVHHFAPSDLPRIPKNLVFIIDRSGSMRGRKMEQTREALLKILGDLAEDDHFGLITFDSSVSTWRKELLPANQDNLEAAKSFARNIHERGATDINAAVLEGTAMLNRHPQEGSFSLLILLTDGDPTTGETNLKKIHKNIKEAIGKKFPLYCLGFGMDVNFDFLEKMALENSGVGRRIYTDSDAALQLQGFYEEVATPLLTDVQMIYLGGANLTQTNFSQYYNGSEIVVAGQIPDNNIEMFTAEVIAISKSNRVMYSDTLPKEEPIEARSDSHIQRLWAYLTVKQLLDKEVQLSGKEKEKVKKEALDLCMKYSFVTPFTSMVVTKPQGEDSQVAHKPKEGEKPIRSSQVVSGSRLQGLKDQVNSHPVMAVQDAYAGPSPKQGLRENAPQRGERGKGIMSRVGSMRRTNDHAVQKSFPDFAMAFLDFNDPPRAHATKTTMRTTTTTVSPLRRFLLPAEGQALPLCYDIPVALSLRLLLDPNNELSMNGQLGQSASAGYRKIVIHYRSDQHIELDTTGITFNDEQNTTYFSWSPKINHKTDSVSLILRDKEMDVNIASTRVVIMLYKRNGITFLWPVLRQRPTGDNIIGIMAHPPVAYEEVQGITMKLKIQDKEVDVSRDSAVDLSVRSTPTVACWLMPLQSALQGELADFTVTQL
ncbi:inter-alpha-trypsin inhibitor heavy chain H3 isoform X1 [Salmo salar]|uniref:Inter-alpha-trypsin inhibitor heavy chain H3 isoform X1 n=1 Tax=Salmo salar TaxID=8030 RepID=A0A1S3L906_SALSA|nr:inter-alpha-trypsin inhibitor heavy chain H3 isoform X1 [Salmo salar]|eukprot:XP_013987448.1 PREDICTED: inter-alpha-trypsin inhibitor heavy chain H3-like isoform X1 [Salmo salar]